MEFALRLHCPMVGRYYWCTSVCDVKKFTFVKVEEELPTLGPFNQFICFLLKSNTITVIYSVDSTI